MNLQNEERHRIIRAGGREFILFYEGEGSGSLMLPDFEAHPEYTAEGRPFMLMIHDECPQCTPKGEICGGCDWFLCEPGCPIGVCMCDAR